MTRDGESGLIPGKGNRGGGEKLRRGGSRRPLAAEDELAAEDKAQADAYGIARGIGYRGPHMQANVEKRDYAQPNQRIDQTHQAEPEKPGKLFQRRMEKPS